MSNIIFLTDVITIQLEQDDLDLDLDEDTIEKMEEARLAYAAALAAAKEDPGEESLISLAEARIKLQAFVL